MKIEKTYNELIEFNQLATIYFSKYPENKLSACIKKIGKQLKVAFESYEDERDTLQLNNCLVDEKTKAILYDETKQIINGQETIVRNRKFSVDGELKLKLELKELRNKTVEIDTRIVEGCKDLIEQLSEEETESFTGLIIP